MSLKFIDPNTGRHKSSANGRVDASGNVSVNFGIGQAWGKISSSQAHGTWKGNYKGRGYHGQWRASKVR